MLVGLPTVGSISTHPHDGKEMYIGFKWFPFGETPPFLKTTISGNN